MSSRLRRSERCSNGVNKRWVSDKDVEAVHDGLGIMSGRSMSVGEPAELDVDSFVPSNEETATELAAWVPASGPTDRLGGIGSVAPGARLTWKACSGRVMFFTARAPRYCRFTGSVSDSAACIDSEMQMPPGLAKLSRRAATFTTVAEQALARGIDVDLAQVDADAKANLVVGGQLTVAKRQRLLHHQRAHQGAGGDGKIGQQAIAFRIDHVSVVVDYLLGKETLVALHTQVSALLILFGEAAVACHVSVQYRREFPGKPARAHPGHSNVLSFRRLAVSHADRDLGPVARYRPAPTSTRKFGGAI